MRVPISLSPGAQPEHPKFADLERTAAAWPGDAAAQRARRASTVSASSPAPKRKEKTKKRRKGKRAASFKELPKYDTRGHRIRPEPMRKQPLVIEKEPWKVDWEKFPEASSPPAKPPLPPAPQQLPPTPSLPRSQSLPPRPVPATSVPRNYGSPQRATSATRLEPLSYESLVRSAGAPGAAAPSALGSARNSRPGSGVLGRSRPGSVSRPASIGSSTLMPPAPRIYRPPSSLKGAPRQASDAASELRALQEKIMYQFQHAEEEDKMEKLQRFAGPELSSELRLKYQRQLLSDGPSLSSQKLTGMQEMARATLARGATQKSGKSDESLNSSASPSKKDVQSHGEAERSLAASIVAKAEHQGPDTPSSQPGPVSLQESGASQGVGVSEDGQEENSETEFKKRLVDMFHRIQESGEVHRDAMPVALGLAGFSANEKLINSLFERLFSYNTMDQSEFVTFVVEYRDLENEKAMEAFRAFDSDGSGVIDRSELEELLEARGVYPLEHVIDELVIEACHGDPANGLQPREFQRVLDILRENEGFSRKEVREFTELFNTCDYDGSGSLDTREIGRIVAILGYSADTKFEEEVTAVDVNGSGELNQKDFLVFLRKIRERDIELVRKFFRDNDTDGSPGLSRHELQSMLRSLHYLPDMTCIMETIKQMGIKDFDRDLNFSEVWRFLEIYRRQQGLPLSHVDAASAAFDEFSEDCFKAPTDKLAAMLRSMGYSLSFHYVQKLAYLVDAEGTGTINKQEFVRVIGRVRQQELKEMWKLFRAKETAENKQEVKELKESLGKFHKEGEEGTSSVVTLEEFLPRAITAQNVKRRQIKANRGFQNMEAEAFRQVFSRCTPDDDGRIRATDLRRLLEDLFPMLSDKSTMKGSRQKLQDILNSSSGGPVGIDEFLSLARYCQDLVEMGELQHEKDAIKKIGFDSSEVDEFRSLFMGGTGQLGDSRITFSELQDLLGKVLPLGHKNAEALREELKATTRTKQGTGEDADFPEFLQLMRRLLDSNFAGIASLSEKKNGRREE